ncbi:hypothetical protein AB1Y20_017632 [Prymnesium parvum]|uniref:Sodium/calcium exchanger membrane region domain-containing protein n=1 Tax=Prymnesium parvum TaxID=97485 RepID=A0AB34JPW4_PRYPA
MALPRRYGRRRRKAAVPLQTGLVLFACAMLTFVAFLNTWNSPPAEGDEPARLLDFRLGSRVLSEDAGSGTSLRWDNPFTSEQMRHGAVILHILLLLYMFTGLAIVCDDYFCAALDEICIKLQISDDVAGATFMAAGGSAPEFFTSLLGVFFFQSDVGFGTIVGSAVFNVLFVIGLCAYFSGFDTLPLTWYPLARDSSYYLVCLAALLGLSYDREITWYDALILCLLYAGYVVIMYFDPKIRRWCLKNLDRSSHHPNHSRPSATAQIAPDPEFGEETAGANGHSTSDAVEKFNPAPASEPFDSANSLPAQQGKEAVSGSCTNGTAGGKPLEEDDDDDVHDGPPQWPDTTKARIIYLINAPLNWSFYLTIPDCRVERKKHYYMLTFTLAVLWIGALSYVMIVMAEDIGVTLGLPDNVMGVTILAIGTSVPDAVSSLLVARDGHGDMALSSSIGSNIFDVTFGLPVPWFIYTALYRSGEVISIEAKGMSIQVGTLMFMVFAVVISVHCFGWKISRPLGIFYFALYFIFVTEALLISQCVISGIEGC